MKNNASVFYAIMLIIGDFLALLAAFTVAYILRVKLDARPLLQFVPARTFFGILASTLPLWIGVHALIGLYSANIYERRFTEFGRLFFGSALGILVMIGYDFVSNDKIFPARLVPAYGLALGFGFLLLFRIFARMLRRALYSFGIGVSNVLLIGDTRLTDEIGIAMHQTAFTGQRIVGVVAKTSDFFKCYSNLQEATQKITAPIHSIIQTKLYNDQLRNNDILQFAQKHHISYRFVPTANDLFVGKIHVDLFAGQPMIAIHQTALIGWGRIVKRLFDIFVSFILIIISLPIMILIAFLEVVVGGGLPVFFRQERITRYNQHFKVFKFRTHFNSISGLSDKEAFAKLGKPQLYEKYKQNGYSLEKDPRVTALGRFLRRSSLDELPQLFNVLKGDISLVGPRALIPEEMSTYEKRHTILSVKSGLTGLAQVSGRQDISFEERRKLDMYYVQNWSFWGDIVILIKTLRVVLTGLGAK